MLTSENNDEELQSYKSMKKLLFSDYDIENVNYTEEAKNEEEVEEHIWRNEAGWLGWSAYAAIEYMLERIPPGKVPLFPSAARNPSKYWIMTARDFLRFSIARMLELFPEVAETKALKQNLQEPPVISGQPELGLDSEQMLNMRRYWSCFIFSLQLYLDIRNILDYQVKDARQQLQVTARTAIENMKKAIKSCDEVWDSEWRDTNEHNIEVIQHYALSDLIYENKTPRAKSMGVTEKLSKFDM